MNALRTAGPWYYGQSPNQRDNYPEQRSIGLAPEEDGGVFGYRLHPNDDDGSYLSLGGYCSEADACLIAAAPDLLAALERVANARMAIDGGLIEECRRIARAAIAKATGGTPDA